MMKLCFHADNLLVDVNYTDAITLIDYHRWILNFDALYCI